MTFHIVDVFGNNRYSGNQLAVFYNTVNLAEREMQQIAREINFSETTFITSLQKISDGYPVRIFTPGSEINFAGHPSLGTAFIVKHYLEPGISGTINLDFRAGRIPVTPMNELWWMKHNQPRFGEFYPAEVLSGVLGLTNEDIDQRFPVREVSTGLPFTLVPLQSLEALKRARIQAKEYRNFTLHAWAKGIMAFCTEGYKSDHDFSVRVFVDYLGIPEDPATGSAAGCLAAYILEHGVKGNRKFEATLGQGFEMGRPSELKIKAEKTGPNFEIHVGGRVIEMAVGTWK